MSQSSFIPLKPIPIKDRVSMIFVYYGRIDVKDGAFVVINEVDGEDRELDTVSNNWLLIGYYLC